MRVLGKSIAFGDSMNYFHLQHTYRSSWPCAADAYIFSTVLEESLKPGIMKRRYWWYWLCVGQEEKVNVSYRLPCIEAGEWNTLSCVYKSRSYLGNLNTEYLLQQFWNNTLESYFVNKSQIRSVTFWNNCFDYVLPLFSNLTDKGDFSSRNNIFSIKQDKPRFW